MDTLDTSTRAGVALAVTLVLLGLTWVVWRRRGPAPGLRWLGVSLLPVAAWLTGTLRLVTEVAGDVARYVSRLVLSPTVWAGVVVLGLAVLLVVVGTALRDRGVGVRGRTARVERRPDSPAAVGAAPAERPARGGGDEGLDDDVADILKRRGIS